MVNNTMKLLIAFAFVLATAHAFNPRAKDIRNTGRIVNGNNANIKRYPYMVEISVPPGFVCGGSLIGSTWILTAAHCVHEATTVEVYLGSHYADDGEVSYVVEAADIIIHPNWYITRADIALLRIPETKPCGVIGFVALPKNGPLFSYYAGEEAFISGWGVTKSGRYPERLQEALVRIMSNEECANFIIGLRFDDLCVDTSNHVAPCDGDSGSPLVLTSGEQVGIFIRGSNHGCESGEPAIYVRVTSYLDWIEAVTGISYK